MKAKKWKSEIKNQMLNIGVYKPEFDRVIDTLSTILEQRDEAYKAFLSDGRHIIMRENVKGGSNPVKNPLLSVWMDLNNQAITFWRECGLTPAALKKIDEKAINAKGAETDPLVALIEEIENSYSNPTAASGVEAPPPVP